MGQCNHQDPYKYKRAAEEVRVFIQCEKDSAAIAGFGGGGRGRKPRRPLTAEKDREQILPYSL